MDEFKQELSHDNTVGHPESGAIQMTLKFNLIIINPLTHVKELRVMSEYVMLCHAVLINTVHEANNCLVHQ